MIKTYTKNENKSLLLSYIKLYCVANVEHSLFFAYISEEEISTKLYFYKRSLKYTEKNVVYKYFQMSLLSSAKLHRREFKRVANVTSYFNIDNITFSANCDACILRASNQINFNL